MTVRVGAIAMGLVLGFGSAPGCVPADVIGPLRNEQDQRERLMARLRASGMAPEVLYTVVPPPTKQEEDAMKRETDSCRAAYLWKGGLTWTGGALVAVAGASTVVGAVATGNTDTNSKIAFGVSAGTLAALGGIFQVVGSVVQANFFDHGCVVRDTLARPAAAPAAAPTCDDARAADGGGGVCPPAGKSARTDAGGG